jgi:hypothetical protein
MRVLLLRGGSRVCSAPILFVLVLLVITNATQAGTNASVAGGGGRRAGGGAGLLRVFKTGKQKEISGFGTTGSHHCL